MATQQINIDFEDPQYLAWQAHVQRALERCLEKATEDFWRQYERRLRGDAGQSGTRRRQPTSRPSEGYSCKICGQPGGEEDSHWIQFCPEKRPVTRKKELPPLEEGPAADHPVSPKRAWGDDSDDDEKKT